MNHGNATLSRKCRTGQKAGKRDKASSSYCSKNAKTLDWTNRRSEDTETDDVLKRNEMGTLA